MDTTRLLLVGVIVVGLSAVGGFLINMTLGAIQRLRASRVPPNAPEVEARLARIEVAVESIALEVERISEMQRFSAKMDADRLAVPRPVARPVTPH